jgi:hypothetical protein
MNQVFTQKEMLLLWNLLPKSILFMSLLLSRSLALIFCCLAFGLHAQTGVMLVAAESGKVVIDGNAVVNLAPYATEKLELTAGKHSLYATSELGAELEMDFEVEEGKMQLLQLTFPPVVPKKVYPLPVLVADLSLPISTMERFAAHPAKLFRDDSELYYAFARADSLLIEAEPDGGGEVFVEVIRYHDWKVIVSTGDSSRVRLAVRLAETGIYIIRVGGVGAKAKAAHVRIRRIPAAEVNRDYVTEVQKYAQFEVLSLLSPTKIELGSTTQSKGGGRSNQSHTSLQVGNEITEWFYSMHAHYEGDVNDAGQASLLSSLRALIESKGVMLARDAAQFKVDPSKLIQPKGSAPIDVYLLTAENGRKLNEDKLFVYITEGSAEDVPSALMRVSCCKGDTYGLGFRNKDVYKGVVVELEAVGLRKGLFLARPVDL